LTLGGSGGVSPRTAVVLTAHGTVDDLDDLPAFLTAIRRGHAPPAALVAEVRRRYEAIGGRSPLTAICHEVAEKLEARLGLPVRLAMRLWTPYPKEVLATLIDEGIERVVTIPLAQHSAHVYGEAVEAAARELADEGRRAVVVKSAKNWGLEPALTRAFAAAIRQAQGDKPSELLDHTALVMTAHSLPLAAIRAGDPYETEVKASMNAIAAELSSSPSPSLAFQSQGMGGGEWLGPDLEAQLESVKGLGKKHVLIAPIGFLADHVEILYDLDIEAMALAKERGLTLSRTRSLNASPGLIDALENVARPLLD
jgi:protoporphyrin/coproporphyrin ferrochelatase